LTADTGSMPTTGVSRTDTWTAPPALGQSSTAVFLRQTIMISLLITGANRGIGFEFVRQYAAAGARIYACCRVPERADALRAIAAASSGAVTLHRLDVAEDESVSALARELKDAPIDILINNAGIKGDLHDMQPADSALWAQVLRINTIAPMRMAWSLRPNLEHGAKRLIVNISSGRGSHPRHRGDGIAYCSSKAALNNAMYGLSVQWAKDGFTIVMIAPGPVSTHMNPDGRLTPEFSIGAMRKIIAGLTRADNGRYLDYEGKDILW
jgi:NAD(P)-dependent dehydrogenase (short-subunit alcohol dehydrogenase family)